jgi:hypothetical protein
MMYALGTAWQGATYLNLFTSGSNAGSAPTAQGGTQLMEQTSGGSLGDVIERSWSVSTSSVPFVGCSSLPAGFATNIWTWTYSFVSTCTALYSYPGCTIGSGYYSVNMTLIIQTLAKPVIDQGANSGFIICALLPGSTRTATLNPTGTGPTSTSTQALSLAQMNSPIAQLGWTWGKSAARLRQARIQLT